MSLLTNSPEDIENSPEALAQAASHPESASQPREARPKYEPVADPYLPRLRAALEVASADSIDADRVARGLSIARDLGLPQSVVMADLKYAHYENVARKIEANPALSAWAAKNEFNAAVAAGNVETLGKLFDSLQKEHEAWQSVRPDLGLGSRFLKLLGEGTQEVAKGIDGFLIGMARELGAEQPIWDEEGNATQTVAQPALNQWADKRAQAVEQIEQERGPRLQAQTALGGYLQDVVRMAPQLLGQAAATLAGGPLGGMAFMGAQIAGGQYFDLKEQGIEQGRAFTAGLANAVMQAPLEQLGFGRLAGIFKTTGLKNIAKRTAEGVLTEGATEFLQSWPEAATDIWARLGKDEGANEWFSRFMDALPETTKQGLYEAAVAAPWGFLGGIGKASYDRAREKAAAAFVQSQTALHEQVEAVLASVKSPEIVESALEAGGQNQVVGVDAKELMRLHQDGKDLLTPLGLSAEDVATASQAGQDVHLPLSRLHSRLNRDEFAAVMPFVRQLPEALNSAEAARIDEKIAADALKAAELHRENAALFEEMTAEKTRLREELSAEIRRSPGLVAQAESLAGGLDAYVDNWLSLMERFAWRMGTSGQNPVEFLRKITLDNVRASRRAQMSPEEIIDDDLRELNGAAEQAEPVEQLYAAMYRSDADNIEEFVNRVREEGPSGKDSAYVFGKITREDAGLNGAEIELWATRVRHIDKRHPDFTGWQNIESVIQNGVAYEINPERSTKSPGRAFVIVNGNTIHAVLGSIENTKRGQRFVVGTSFQGNQKAFEHWLKQNKATLPYQDTGGSPAQPKPTNVGRLPELKRSGSTNVEITPVPSPVNRLTGNATQILGAGLSNPARYEVWELEDVIPSHDPENGFARNGKYPAQAQERPYHSDQGEQEKVRANALGYEPEFTVNTDPTAGNGPSIITKDGIVLGGNSRAMSLQLVYAQKPEKAAQYREALKEKAAQFGLDPASLDAMRRPVLVRVVENDLSLDEMAVKSRLYNQTTTQKLQAKAEGVSRGRLLSPETLSLLAAEMAEFDSLRQFLDSSRSKAFVQALVQDGVIERTELSSLTDKAGRLNESGKSLAENALRGLVLPDYDILADTPQAVLNKLDRAIPALARLKTRGEGWDLTNVITPAMRLVAQSAKENRKLEGWLGQVDLLDQDTDKKRPAVQALALTFANATQKEVLARFEAFAKASERQQKNVGLLVAEPEGAKPASAFVKAFLQPLVVVDDKQITDFDPLNNPRHAALLWAYENSGKSRTIAAAQTALEKIMVNKKTSAARKAEARETLSQLAEYSGGIAIHEPKLGPFFHYRKGEKLFQFIGQRGAARLDAAHEATTRLDNLAVARQMETAGKDARTIKLATGWERGADSQWRYEVDDVALKDSWLEERIEAISDTERYHFPFHLADAINEEISKAYPETENTICYIYIDPAKRSMSSYSPAKEDSGGAYYDGRDPEIIISEPTLEDVKLSLIHEVQHLIQDAEGFAQGGDIREVGVKRYKALAGEVEARNVERRSSMTAEERLASLAKDTEDVAREDQEFLLTGAQEAMSSLSVGRTNSLGVPLSRVTKIEGNVSPEDVEAALRELAGQDLPNEIEGITAQVNTQQRGKLKSAEAANKSVANGFTRNEHRSLAAQIANAWKWAADTGLSGDKNEMPDVSVRRFVSALNVNGKESFAWITVKESPAGLRIYSVELMQKEKLRDMLNSEAEKTAPTTLHRSFNEIIGRLSAPVKGHIDPRIFYQYLNNKKSRQWASSSGLQLPRVGTHLNGKETIFTDADLVNLKNQFPEYFHPGGANPRGSTTIYPESYLINLFASANLSTLLHETGHVFFEEMERMVESGAADESLRQDYAILRDWLGATSGEPLSVEQREKAARGFEAYLMEGKAPAVELESAFARFKRWLLKIYQSAVALDAPLTDEVRGVFDRMISTEREMAQAAARNELLDLTARELDALGLTGQQRESAASLMTRGREAAAEALEKARAENRKARLEKYHKEALEEVREMQAYKARRALRATPLDLEAVREGFGEEVAKKLQKAVPGSLKNESGIDPEIFAAEQGYESAAAMFADVLAARNQRSKVAELREDKEAKHDEAFDALEQLLETREVAIQMELVGRKLSELLGVQSIESEAYRLAAQQELQAMPLGRAVQTGVFLAAMRRALQQMRQGLLQGDREAALVAQRKAALNMEFARQSRALSKSRESLANAMKRFVAMHKGNPDARYIVMDIGARFGLLRENQQLAEGRSPTTIRDWLTQVAAEGYEIFPDEATLYGEGKPWRSMSVAEFESLAETVGQIVVVERNQRKLLTTQGKASLDEVGILIATNLYAHFKKHPEKTVESQPAAVRALKSLHAIHTKIEALCLAIDGDQMGVAYEFIYKRVSDAEDRQAVRLRGVKEDLASPALFGAYSRKELAEMGTRKELVPEIGERLTRAERMALALNMGNAVNIERIKSGHGWSDAQIAAILKPLTARDWRFVQAVWDYLGTFKEEAFQLEEECNGLRPKEVEAKALTVQTADGETLQLAGGYYPIRYNPEKGDRAFAMNQKEMDKELMGGRNYGSAMTRHGHLKARESAGLGTPLLLELSVITDHVFNVVHDLCYRKAVLDVAKVINHPKVREAFESTVGPEMYRQLKPWLQDAANQTQEPMHQIHRWARWARASASIMQMGYKITTLLMQPIGITQSMELLGYGWTARGIRHVYGNLFRLPELLQETYARSPFMQTRVQGFDREVHDITRRLKPGLGRFGWLQVVKDKAFVPMGIIQMGVDLPTWWGAYEKGLKDFSGDEAKAAQYADSIVRMSQGSGAAKDLSRVQRGNELMRLTTMFYSYFNTLYQLGARRIAWLKQHHSPADIFTAANTALLLWFVPAILSELVVGRGPDDDDDKWKWASRLIAQYPFQTVVGVRDIASGVFGSYGYQITPAQSAPASLVKWFASVNKALEKEDPALLAKPTAEAVGYAFSLPLKQPIITVGNLWNYLTGKDPDFAVRDLFFVKKKEKK